MSCQAEARSVTDGHPARHTTTAIPKAGFDIETINRLLEPRRCDGHTSGGMARVFLADDDDSFRFLTRLRLEDAGHEIVGEARDAEGCTRGLAGAAADVALIDGFLRLDGWDELRRASPSTKLVLFSGMPFDLSDDAGRLEADAHIAKSAPVRELVALVARLSES